MLAVTREIDTFESDERRRSRTTSDKSKYTVTAATAFYRIIAIDWLINALHSDNFHTTTHGDCYRGESGGLSSFDFDSYAGKSIVFLEVSGQARIGYGRI